MAHTPGPWKIEYPLEDEMDEQPQITAHEGKTLVATILGPLSDEDGLARGAYDARLMQAAPEMLAVCKDALMHIQAEVESEVSEESEGPAVKLHDRLLELIARIEED